MDRAAAEPTCSRRGRSAYRSLPALLIALAALTGRIAAAAPVVPPGFQESLVVGGLDEPTTLAFAPDGRLFIGEKASGKIRIVENGALLATAFLDMHDLVPPGTTFDSFFERGLLGIAFHPSFASNRLVYIYYTLCKQPFGNSCALAKNRVVRVHATGNVADGADPVLILDDIDSDAGNHNAGWLGFGPDGKLYVSTGDGGDVHEKSQDLGSLSGKVLRLNLDGSVPANNPFAGAPGARGEIWASGLRNPWRCRFGEDDGPLLCGDVGEGTWEEIDVIFRANDYGWPASEGPFTLSEHPTLTPPIHWYAHAGSSASITGGDFGAKTNFPGDYAASYFFADFARGVIQRIVLDMSGTAAASEAFDFVTGIGGNSVTDLVAGPDGALYYTKFENVGSGEVRKVFVATDNDSPIAVAGAQHPGGGPPLTVDFSSAGSFDPNGDALTFSWSFGDGTPDVLDAAPSHTYQNAGEYIATLRVSDGQPSPGPGVATVLVTVGMPPTVTIDEPVNGALFNAGDSITLAGSATDQEDGTLASSKLQWKIVFHHDEHTHPFIDKLTGASQSFTTAASGETDPDVGYEIILSATDSDGITRSTSVTIAPRTVDLTFETSPAGLLLTVDGQPHVAPVTLTSVVGLRRTIGAPNQTGFAFSAWSDGGNRTHTVTSPADDTTYSAVFVIAPTATPTPPPVPSITPTPIGLVDPAAARAADACQRTIGQASVALVRAVLGGLARCTNSVQLCIQTRPEDDACIPKARAACVKALGAIDGAAAKMRAGIQRRCTNTADLLATLGVGFADVAVDCGAHGMPANDVAGLAACLAARQRCASERLLTLHVPRAGELLRVAGVADHAASCLLDRLGDGAHVVPPATAKAFAKCAAAIAKAAAGFASGRTKAFTGCAQTLFSCAQRKPLPAALATCLAKGGAICARAANGDAATLKMRAAINARCADATVPYATLRSAAAAYLDAVGGDCADHDVTDVESLAAYQDCVAQQHQCLAADMVRTALPRTDELLAIVGQTLGPDVCPAAAVPQ